MPRDESARLTYVEWQDAYNSEKPYQIFSSLTSDLSDLSTTNLVFKDGESEVIRDARKRENDFRLDKQGFQFCQHKLRLDDISSEEAVRESYLPQMEDLLRRNVDGVERVFFFDWRIRKNVPITTPVIDANDKMQYLLPARHVHIDQTPSAVIGRVQLHMKEEAASLLQGRVRVINLWRPIIDTVRDRPLVFCDQQTVHKDDVLEADHIRKHYSGSNYYALPSAHYDWYYLNEQTKDEVTLIQMFDSAKSGISGTLHTSFDHAQPPMQAEPRQSIEVRALVFGNAPVGSK